MLRKIKLGIINWCLIDQPSVSPPKTANNYFSKGFGRVVGWNYRSIDCFDIQMRLRIEPDRAKAIGRQLFQKYDLGKRGALGPKQCYEIFSDFCYRILAIHPQPTMEEANSMYEVLDENKDKKVTQSDFQSLAVRFLCSGGNSYQIPQPAPQVTQTSSRLIGSQTSFLQGSNVSKYSDPRSQKSVKNLTVIAQKRIDVARRLFKMFDKDQSGFLTEDEIPFIIEQTYKQMGQNYKPTRDDVKSYMKMVDGDGDGRISLSQFQQIILRSLKNAGFEIYE